MSEAPRGQIIVGTAADRGDHVAGLLAIATPATLADPAFVAGLRARLRAIAADLRQSPEAGAP